jgi:hypothetical protein
MVAIVLLLVPLPCPSFPLLPHTVSLSLGGLVGGGPLVWARWALVVGCRSSILVCSSLAISTHDPPCEQWLAVVGGGGGGGAGWSFIRHVAFVHAGMLAFWVILRWCQSGLGLPLVVIPAPTTHPV